jgi:hypothetical protein
VYIYPFPDAENAGFPSVGAYSFVYIVFSNGYISATKHDFSKPFFLVASPWMCLTCLHFQLCTLSTFKPKRVQKRDFFGHPILYVFGL